MMLAPKFRTYFVCSRSGSAKRCPSARCSAACFGAVPMDGSLLRTTELADIVLPDVVDAERHEVASSPTALWPWLGMSYPEIPPRGDAQPREKGV